MRLFLLLLLSIASMALSAQVTSDFNDSSTQGWDNGNMVADPTVELGGPDGPMDPFLQITATGGGGPGSKMAAFNTTSNWTGNFIENQIGAIELNAANFSNQDLTIRLVIESGVDRLVTNTALSLAAGDDSWQGQLFLLSEEDLIGSADYNTVLSNVTKVWIFHGGTSFPGPSISAVVGIDNVTQQIDVSSVQTFGQEVFSLSPSAQPARSGEAALLLNTEVNGSYQIDVFDLNGRNVSSLSGTTQAQSPQRIDLDDLTAGNYVIRFTLRGSFGRSVRTQRLIVH